MNRYDALVEQIKREDTLVGNRVNWYLVSQGFLFASAGLLLDSNIYYKKEVFKAISIVGIILGASVFSGVLGAEISMYHLGKRWQEMREKYIDDFPAPYGEGCAYFLGAAPRFVIPVLLTTIWGVSLGFSEKIVSAIKDISCM